jgi:hypothetical protein
MLYGRLTRNFVALCISTSAISKPVTHATDSTAFDPAKYASVANSLRCDDIPAKIDTVPSLTRAFRNLMNSPSVINGAVAAKDQFETSASYQSRLDRLWKQPLGGSSRIIGVIEISGTATYDADKQQLTMHDLFRRQSNDKSTNSTPIYVAHLIVGGPPDGSYVGSNAFGRSTKVDVTRITNVDLQLSEVPSGPLLRDTGYGVDLVVPSSPETARGLLHGGRVVLSTTARTPLVTYSFERDRPTLDDPTDLFIRSYGLSVTFECALVIGMDGKAIGSSTK